MNSSTSTSRMTLGWPLIRRMLSISRKILLRAARNSANFLETESLVGWLSLPWAADRGSTKLAQILKH